MDTSTPARAAWRPHRQKPSARAEGSGSYLRRRTERRSATVPMSASDRPPKDPDHSPPPPTPTSCGSKLLQNMPEVGLADASHVRQREESNEVLRRDGCYRLAQTSLRRRLARTDALTGERLDRCHIAGEHDVDHDV